MPAARLSRGALPTVTPTAVIAAAAATASAVVVAGFALQSTSSFLRIAAPTLLGGVALWMFLSEHYERTLAVLALYLGLFDGYLKLKTGSTIATLGRDVLLYAIAAGALIRWSFSGRRVRLPTLTPGVVVWVVICFAEVLNPVVPSITHAFAGVRQHIEFVPLFFLGYAVMRSERRLLGLFALLLFVAAVNGVVGLIQSHLSPASLAAWGPGYAKEVIGTGSLTGGGRTFVDANGIAHVRPPALGFGLWFWRGGRRHGASRRHGACRSDGTLPALPSAHLAGVVLAVVGVATSQARVDVVSAADVVLFFLLLAATTRGGLAAVVIAGLLGLVIYFGLTSVFSTVTSSSNRYGSIAPTQVISHDQLPRQHARPDSGLPRGLSARRRHRLRRPTRRQLGRRD